LYAIAELLEMASRQLIQEHRKRATSRRPRVRCGATLRPGSDTPLWNALVAAVKPRLRKRGDRALLARELGLHRARVGEFFDQQSGMPDAERTLRLVLWLSHQSGSIK